MCAFENHVFAVFIMFYVNNAQHLPNENGILLDDAQGFHAGQAMAKIRDSYPKESLARGDNSKHMPNANGILLENVQGFHAGQAVSKTRDNYPKESLARVDNSSYVVCYFSMGVNDSSKVLNSTLCSHIIFIPSVIKAGVIAPQYERHIDLYYSTIPLLKLQNPNLKILLSNGGGSGLPFDDVLSSETNRSRFSRSVLVFLRKYGFDGIDMDWEFPGWNGRPVGQRHNFTLVLQQLRLDIENEKRKPDQNKLLLTAAVSASYVVMDIYEIKLMANSVDFINLMAYDFHYFAFYDPFTGFNSALYPQGDKGWRGNTAWAAREWVRRGMPQNKVIVGIPTYLHAWKLLSSKLHGLFSPAIDTGNYNFGGYDIVCSLLKKGADRVFDNDACVPYAYHNDQWISYEDVTSVKIKSTWIKQQRFGGVMVYEMGSDDHGGTCDGKTKFPLISAIHNIIMSGM